MFFSNITHINTYTEHGKGIFLSDRSDFVCLFFFCFVIFQVLIIAKNTKYKLLSENREKEKKITKVTLTYHQVHVDSPLVVANWNIQEDSRTIFVVKLIDQRKKKKTKRNKNKKKKNNNRKSPLLFMLFTRKKEIVLLQNT